MSWWNPFSWFDDDDEPDPNDPDDIRNYGCAQDEEGYLLDSSGERLFDKSEWD